MCIQMTPTKKLQYSEQDLQNALLAVENGLSYNKASKSFKIPKTTLIYKYQGKTPMPRKMGPSIILTAEEENLLVNWLFHMCDRGFPATKDTLLDSIQLLMKNLKRENPFTNNRPGRRWYELFQNRHPELTVRVSQSLSRARASVTEGAIRNWFSEAKAYLDLQKYFDISNDSNRVFNCDESAFFLSPKESKVLVRKGEDAVYNFINNDEKECLTALIMCNTAGQLPPPMVVYSYKRIPQKVVEQVPKEWGVGRTENGWMTGESFYEYITNIFYSWLVENKVELPIILFVDGHTSHLTMALSEFCSKKGIILVFLFPNSTQSYNL
ncbi:hypothetical protein NQ314_021375 [Rhamnusium bicolor]|uniref:HTH CENPB-type domain-containing protein n=1 Tax=Rhamnusium bicolor TaxID=1586634 RepID=A0AAV8WIC9_9CUCU|nr:hypothetical protein NQ314_021375 [Rhamnusium bicolor]